MTEGKKKEIYHHRVLYGQNRVKCQQPDKKSLGYVSSTSKYSVALGQAAWGRLKFTIRDF